MDAPRSVHPTCPLHPLHLRGNAAPRSDVVSSRKMSLGLGQKNEYGMRDGRSGVLALLAMLWCSGTRLVDVWKAVEPVRSRGSKPELKSADFVL